MFILTSWLLPDTLAPEAVNELQSRDSRTVLLLKKNQAFVELFDIDCHAGLASYESRIFTKDEIYHRLVEHGVISSNWLGRLILWLFIISRFQVSHHCWYEFSPRGKNKWRLMRLDGGEF